MKTLIFLGILIFIYYQLFKRFPEKFVNEHHIYFGIFITGYLTLYYLMTFQKPFVYRVFKNNGLRNFEINSNPFSSKSLTLP